MILGQQNGANTSVLTMILHRHAKQPSDQSDSYHIGNGILLLRNLKWLTQFTFINKKIEYFFMVAKFNRKHI